MKKPNINSVKMTDESQEDPSLFLKHVLYGSPTIQVVVYRLLMTRRPCPAHGKDAIHQMESRLNQVQSAF